MLSAAQRGDPVHPWIRHWLSGGYKRCVLPQKAQKAHNCRAVCTNKGDHRDAFSNSWHEMLCVSKDLLSRPLILERSERKGLFFFMPINNPVDSTFEQSENVAVAPFLVVSLSSCCWPTVRDVAYAIIGSRFVLLSSACVHCTNWQSCQQYCFDFLWTYTVNSSCMYISHFIPWLWHQNIIYLLV